MTANHNEGGPAFPAPRDHGGSGMSLRDWFAGQALACGPISGAASSETILAAAQWAYCIADAMIAARGKP